FALVKCYIIFKQYYTAYRLVTDINHISARLNVTYKEDDLKKFEIFLLLQLERYEEVLELSGENSESEISIMRAYSLWQLDKVKEADQLLKAIPEPARTLSAYRKQVVCIKNL